MIKCKRKESRSSSSRSSWGGDPSKVTKCNNCLNYQPPHPLHCSSRWFYMRRHNKNYYNYIQPLILQRPTPTNCRSCCCYHIGCSVTFSTKSLECNALRFFHCKWALQVACSKRERWVSLFTSEYEHYMHIWPNMHIWALQIWSSGVKTEKRIF